MLASQCIDNANNIYVPYGITTDLDGHSRIVDGDCNGIATVDMGAYEFTSASYGDFEGNDCDVDFGDYSIIAEAWYSEKGQAGFDPICDIALPNDERIDLLDLAILCEHWLFG